MLWSSNGMPSRFRFNVDEKEKPVTAATFPSANIGSRVGKPTGSTVIASISRPFSAAKIGNCAQAPSGGGAPSTLPSRSFGVSMPSDLRPDHRKGRLVINHHHCGDWGARVLVEETHQRIDVGKADRKRTGCDFRNGIERASAFGNFHRKAFAFEIALVDSDEVGCGGTLELPVESEIDFFLGESAGGKGRGPRRQRQIRI